MEQFIFSILGFIGGYTFYVIIKINKAIDKYLEDKEV